MSNALEEQKPQRLLDNALAFSEAGKRCAALSKTSFPPYKEADLGSPAVVCHAFAIEQFLKLLLLLETGEYPDREHALDTLFDGLPSLPGHRPHLRTIRTDTTGRIPRFFNLGRGARNGDEDR